MSTQITLGAYSLEYTIPKSVQLESMQYARGLRQDNFVNMICTLFLIDTGLYATLPWVQLSGGHFALFASVAYSTVSGDVKFIRLSTG